MPIDPSILPKQPGVLIDYDRPCAACGYNLIGLTLDDSCPECGSAIKRPLSIVTAASEFARWTPEGLRSLAWTFRALGTLGVLIPLCAWWWSVTSGRLFPYLAAALTMGFSLAWVGAVWSMTRVPRAVFEVRGVTLSRPAWWLDPRPAARVCSWLVPAAAGPGIILTVAPGTALAPALEWVGVGLSIAACLGTFPALLVLALFARESHDDLLDDASKWCLFGIPLGMPVGVLVGAGTVWSRGWIPVALLLGSVWLLVTLAWVAWSLAGAAAWAAEHAETDAERAERRERRRDAGMPRRHGPGGRVGGGGGGGGGDRRR